MALYDDPPHRISTYTVASTRDTGGGTALSYTLAQSGVPCSINKESAGERLLYAQQNIAVTHTVAILPSVLTRSITRGMKVVDESDGTSFHVLGVNGGQAYGTIPELLYLSCQEIL